MASIIEGCNYDIFISYRQKDNKYSCWVTEFVGNLKKELEVTFKVRFLKLMQSFDYEERIPISTTIRTF